MTEKTSVQPGRYRHYKGKEYTVAGTARHSETLEELVVYRQEYGERGLPQEVIDTLVGSAGVRIKRIVSQGHASPEGFWYDQDQHEWVAVLKGAARLRFEGETVEMKPGAFVNIPAHKKHRVEWTTPDEPTVWLAVFYGGTS